MLMYPTIEKLKALKLYGMAEGLNSFTNNPDSEALSFNERLGIIVDREIILRDNNRQTRLLKEAKLRYPDACIENIDYEHTRGLEKSHMITLAQCNWLRKKQNVIFLGPAGVGKSYLACALGKQACREGLSVRYFRMIQLFELIRASQAIGKYRSFMSKLSRTELIIFDDFGLNGLNSNERQDLLEILENRHALRSSIVTCQLPVDLWHDYIGEETIADAILDRLLSCAHKIDLSGESVRQKDKDPDLIGSKVMSKN